jgi:hypothetical protein
VKAVARRSSARSERSKARTASLRHDLLDFLQVAGRQFDRNRTPEQADKHPPPHPDDPSALLVTGWTPVLRRDPRAAMEQGGRLDIRSLLPYSHDVPEYRRRPRTGRELGASRPDLSSGPDQAEGRGDGLYLRRKDDFARESFRAPC